MEKERLRSLIQDLVAQRLDVLRAQPAPSSPPPASAASAAAPVSRPAGGQRIITRDDVEKITFGGVLKVPRGAIITALAREIAADRQIRLSMDGDPGKAVAVGADHGGFELKEKVKAYVQQLGYEVKDLGTFDANPVDYPDFALAVAMCVAHRECAAGIVVDGAGIGSCMTANKVPGVRAALCYDEATARNSREHNFANVLTLGGRMIGEDVMRKIVKTWLETPFGEERHARRVRKIAAIESKYCKNSATDSTD